MMEFDTFYLFQNLSHAVRGCHNSVLSLRVNRKGKHVTTMNKCALTSQLACTRHQDR